MQDYIDFAAKNGVVLRDTGPCQFCGAPTERGIHECLEIFQIGFQGYDFSAPGNHIYRFLVVDAHCLQHPEIHGRWSNHFHLTRLHLMFKYEVKWTYQMSPQLSDHLNRYKASRADEYLTAPPALERGSLTSWEVRKRSVSWEDCKAAIRDWAKEVYACWEDSHGVVEAVARGFLGRGGC